MSEQAGRAHKEWGEDNQKGAKTGADYRKGVDSQLREEIAE